MRRYSFFLIVILVSVVFCSCCNYDKFFIFKKTYNRCIDSDYQSMIATNVILAPPKIKLVNWKDVFNLMIQDCLCLNEVDYGSSLFISNVQNVTNIDLDTEEATCILIDLVSTSNKFAVIDCTKKMDASVAFGLKQSDTLISCVKIMELARYLNAKYVLYSTLYGDVKNISLEIKLILVNSGELIWSEKHLVL